MAGFVEKFKKMWDSPDDEYDYDEYEEEENGYEEEYDRESEREREREYRRAERAERRKYTTDAYTEYEGNNNKVVNINTKIQVVLFKPERFGDETIEIADEFTKNRTVVLNLENTNRDMSRRILDFVSGVAYAKKGKIKKVSNNTFIVMPENVDFTGDDLLDELESNGILF